MRVGRYEGSLEDGTLQLVYERELPDEGPFDPPLVMKAGEVWAMGMTGAGSIPPFLVQHDATMTQVIRQSEEYGRTCYLLWPEVQEWSHGELDIPPPTPWYVRLWCRLRGTSAGEACAKRFLKSEFDVRPRPGNY